MLSLSPSLPASLLGLKVLTERSGVSVLPQKTNTLLFSCLPCLVFFRSSPLLLSFLNCLYSLHLLIFYIVNRLLYSCTPAKAHRSGEKVDQEWFRSVVQVSSLQNKTKTKQTKKSILEQNVDQFTLSGPPWWYLSVYVHVSMCWQCVRAFSI